MKKATVFLVVTVFALAFSANAAEFTGHISDAKCGAAHADHSEGSIKCVTNCVKAGQAPVFVTADGEVVKIANPDKVQGHLGHQVKINATQSGDTLTIDTVEHVAP